MEEASATTILPNTSSFEDFSRAVPHTQKFISRDEMNLAEFPLTILSTRANPKVKTLEFRDSVKGKNGELINREWVITGADKFGLPTASDDEVLLGLLKLSVDEGLKQRKVFFTRYELLRILRWTTEGRSYSRLQKALDRLSGVRIKTSNGFFDNESKLYSTKNFGLIDEYEINNGRDPQAKSSFFIWSEVLFQSFSAGFIKKLDLEYYLSLNSAVSKRLYRFLDKHFWYKSRVQINLFTLCHEKIGISRNYKYASSLRQQIDPAVEELIASGFLSKVEYFGRGRASEIVLYASSNAKVLPKATSSNSSNSQLSLATSSNQNGASSGNVEALQEQVLRRLVERGIRNDQAQKLIGFHDANTLGRVGEIIDYYDSLIRSRSHLVSRSPVGFLYHAIKNAGTFVLPRERQAKRGEVQEQTSFGFKFQTEKKQREQSLEGQFLIERRRELQRIREEKIDPDMLKRITKEVETALIRIRENISPKRFEEAVQHGVDEKLARLFAVPDYSEWLVARGSQGSDSS